MCVHVSFIPEVKGCGVTCETVGATSNHRESTEVGSMVLDRTHSFMGLSQQDSGLKSCMDTCLTKKDVKDV